ncbi:MAG: hypothetical protein KGL92_13890 [Gammaproteobacteria bacterium]|nr:hypothetical protein [Gammaproteobacteria bacterium]
MAQAAEPLADAAVSCIERVFEHLPFGLLLLESDLTVRLRLGREFSTELAVRVRFDRLELPKPALRQVRSLFSGKTTTGPTLIKVHGSDGIPVALVFERVSAGGPVLWRVGIFAEDGAVPTAAALRLTYGLTPSEAGVVRQLVAGRCLRITAQILDISHETARAHLKNAFLKANARCQAALVARVLSGPAMLLGRDRVEPAVPDLS